MPAFRPPAHKPQAAPRHLLADRLAVLRLLAAGPVLGAAAGERCAALLGWTLDRWFAAVDSCPWVTCLGHGRAGWRLTWRGRRELDKGAT
jgi:hypothetical protein